MNVLANDRVHVTSKECLCRIQEFSEILGFLCNYDGYQGTELCFR